MPNNKKIKKVNVTNIEFDLENKTIERSVEIRAKSH